jgi:hypothetical protein
MTKDTEQSESRFLVYYALFWAFLGWIGLVAAMAGYFQPWIFLAYIITVILIYLVRSKKALLKTSKEFLIVNVTLIIFVMVLSFFSTPTVFSGRDQGSISEAAIRLSQNHQLSFSNATSDEFFKIYGPGKALNFPGFYYTYSGKLITQFPLGYISWLAIFYSFFGLSGFIIANALLLYLFLLFFYFLARLFFRINYSVILLAVTITSFPFIWFSKLTLSENMALAFLWMAIFSLIAFIKNSNKLNYLACLLLFLLLPFIRVEGFAFLAAGLILILSFPMSRNYLKANFFPNIILPFLFFSSILGLNVSVNYPFYKEIAKALLNVTANSQAGIIEKYILPFIHVSQIQLVYGTLSFFVLGTAGIIYFIVKRDWKLLIPFFVTLSSYLYLINSNISTDHPWMLRRFVFSILPAFIFYAIFFLSSWKEKIQTSGKRSIFYLIIILLILLNSPAFFRYFTFSENKNLLEETQEISQNFSSQDLILVDRKASGDGWAMLAGPLSSLYGKNAVYFFNTEDLKKINLDKFNRIFLMVPEENLDFYAKIPLAQKLRPFKDYTLNTARLDLSQEKSFLVSLPPKENVEVKGKIFEIVK